MPNRSAQVWYDDRRVGTLRDEQRELYFTYDEEWLNGKDVFPISINLPLTGKETYAHPFFSGLLPEGGARERICRQRGIDIRDDVGLLFAIGEDCAGAMSIVSETSKGDRETPRELTTATIEKLARAKGELDIGQEERRFSLAGAQEKQPIIFDQGGYALPTRFYPSTHILKFETFPLVCFAEVAANQLASLIGLPVVKTEYLETKGRDPCPFLRIERYDRIRNGIRIVRLHQEDLLQAIGEPTALKYESEGGPNISRIAEVLRDHSSEPARSILQLRDWQMFNYLIGNWDGHAKNLALLYEPGSAAPKLAPFYDLVAIEYLNAIGTGMWSRKLAFRIGQNEIPERVTLNDWKQFADELLIPGKPTLERLGQLADALPDAAIEVRKDLADRHGDRPVYARFPKYIAKRCRWMERQLKHV